MNKLLKYTILTTIAFTALIAASSASAANYTYTDSSRAQTEGEVNLEIVNDDVILPGSGSNGSEDDSVGVNGYVPIFPRPYIENVETGQVYMQFVPNFVFQNRTVLRYLHKTIQIPTLYTGLWASPDAQADPIATPTAYTPPFAQVLDYSGDSTPWSLNAREIPGGFTRYEGGQKIEEDSIQAAQIYMKEHQLFVSDTAGMAVKLIKSVLVHDSATGLQSETGVNVLTNQPIWTEEDGYGTIDPGTGDFSFVAQLSWQGSYSYTAKIDDNNNTVEIEIPHGYSLAGVFQPAVNDRITIPGVSDDHNLLWPYVREHYMRYKVERTDPSVVAQTHTSSFNLLESAGSLVKTAVAKVASLLGLGKSGAQLLGSNGGTPEPETGEKPLAMAGYDNRTWDGDTSTDTIVIVPSPSRDISLNTLNANRRAVQQSSANFNEVNLGTKLIDPFKLNSNWSFAFDVTKGDQIITGAQYFRYWDGYQWIIPDATNVPAGNAIRSGSINGAAELNYDTLDLIGKIGFSNAALQNMFVTPTILSNYKEKYFIDVTNFFVGLGYSFSEACEAYLDITPSQDASVDDLFQLACSLCDAAKGNFDKIPDYSNYSADMAFVSNTTYAFTLLENIYKQPTNAIQFYKFDPEEQEYVDADLPTSNTNGSNKSPADNPGLYSMFMYDEELDSYIPYGNWGDNFENGVPVKTKNATPQWSLPNRQTELGVATAQRIFGAQEVDNRYVKRAKANGFKVQLFSDSTHPISNVLTYNPVVNRNNGQAEHSNGFNINKTSETVSGDKVTTNVEVINVPGSLNYAFTADEVEKVHVEFWDGYEAHDNGDLEVAWHNEESFFYGKDTLEGVANTGVIETDAMPTTFTYKSGNDLDDYASGYAIRLVVDLKDGTQYISNSLAMNPSSVQEEETIAVDNTINNSVFVSEYLYGGGPSNSTINNASYPIPYAIDLPAEPYNESYVFEGWFKDKNYSTKITGIQLTGIDESVLEYHAKWVDPAKDNKTVWQIMLNANYEGAAEIDPIYSASGESTTIANPTRSGYDFVGWTVAPDGGVIVNPSIGFYGHTKLYAQWVSEGAQPAASAVTVRYHNYDGAGSVQTEVYHHVGDNVDQPYQTAYAHHHLNVDMPWTTDAANKNAFDRVLEQGDVSGGLDLYANWDANQVNVTFKSTLPGREDTVVTVEYGQTFAQLKIANNIDDLEFSEPSLSFGAWTFSGTGNHDDTVSSNYAIQGEEEFYANWKGIVTLNTTTGNPTYDPEHKTYEGIYYPALQTPIPVQQIWYGDTIDLTSFTSLMQSNVNLTNVADWLGWFNNSEGTSAFNQDTPITENTTIYAKWELKEGSDPEPVNAHIGVHAYGGAYNITWGTDQSINYNGIDTAVGTLISDLDLPTSGTLTDGAKTYTFAGWYYDKSYEESVEGDDVITRNFDLHAKWVNAASDTVWQVRLVEFNYETTDYYVVDGEDLPDPNYDPDNETQFRGWGDGGDPEQLLDKARAHEILYARWGDNTITVTYHSSDGMQYKQVTTSVGATPAANEDIADLGITPPEHKHLVYWSTMPNNDLEMWKFGLDQTFRFTNNNINLYAVWQIDLIYIDFSLLDIDGGIGGYLDVEYGDTFDSVGQHGRDSFAAEIASDNLHFGKWTLDPDDHESPAIPADSVVDENWLFIDNPHDFDGDYSPEDSVTRVYGHVYANITYDTTTGNNTPFAVPILPDTAWYGDTIDLTAHTAAMEGNPYATFEGWYTNPDFLNEHLFNPETPITHDITLYAKFATPMAHLSLFTYADAAAFGEHFTEWDYLLDSVDVQIGTVMKAAENGDPYYWLMAYMNEGSTVDDDDSVMWVDGEFYADADYNTLIDLRAADGYTVTGNTEFHVRWYTWTAEEGAKTEWRVQLDDNYVDAPAPTYHYFYDGRQLPTPVHPEGKEFLGWFADPLAGDVPVTMATKHETLYARWGGVPAPIAVKYHTNFGTDTVVTDDNTLIGSHASTPNNPAFNRTGYHVIGWKAPTPTGPDFETTFSSGMNGLDLYAQWAPDTYALKFNDTLSDVTYDTVATYGETLSDVEPQTPANGNWHFGGWSATPGGHTPVSNSTPITAAGNYYAIWYHIVQVNLNEGTGVNNQIVYQGETFNFAALPEPSYLGHHFKGWYADPGFNTLFVQASPVELDADIPLYAKWSEGATVRVTFDYTGGQFNGADKAYQDIQDNGASKAQEPLEIERPTRTGYTFAGWREYGKQLPFDFNTIITDPITIEAVWTPNQYTLNFDLNGAPAGNQPDGVPTSQTEVYDSIPGSAGTHNPEWVGHEFAGWTTVQNGDESTRLFGLTGLAPRTNIAGFTNYYGQWIYSASQVTSVYAKWTLLSYPVQYKFADETQATKQVSGQVVPIEDEDVFYGSNLTHPGPAFNDINHEFLGWYLDKDFSGDPYDFSTPVEGPITLYAKMGDIVRHHVRFFIGTHTNPVVYNEVASADVVDGANAQAAIPHYNEYEVFEGWFKVITPAVGDTPAQLAPVKFDFAHTPITAPTDFYAVYRELTDEEILWQNNLEENPIANNNLTGKYSSVVFGKPSDITKRSNISSGLIGHKEVDDSVSKVVRAADLSAIPTTNAMYLQIPERTLIPHSGKYITTVEWTLSINP
ncbi:MAG: InlB B-repeat-containing protein [Lactobacillales bacterium]|nr:InlB B-repeat-containing protein [Lactobacillales bacterium]